MSSFGFDVENVFGTARKGRKGKKGKSKRKKDSMESVMDGSFDSDMGLGIDTFSLESPRIDALDIGGDFGEVIGSRAGLANGKQGGFLDIIGKQQFSVPSVVGRGTIARGRGRGKGRARTTRARTPLQRSTGTRFGDVDREFAGNVIGNIRGAKKRISEFREKRRKSKTVSTRDPPQLEMKQPRVRNGEFPALPAPPDERRSAI